MSRPMSQMIMNQPGSQISLSGAQDCQSRVKMTGVHLVPADAPEPSFTRPSYHDPVNMPELIDPDEEVPMDVLPPPLCPMLVMPTCEARFGVPMYELAEVK